MKLNSTTLGIVILILFFGGIAASASIGWWRTEEAGGQNRLHGEGNGEILQQLPQSNPREGESESHALSTLHGMVNRYDQLGITITTDDGRAVYVKLGSKRYNRSIGFSPLIGEVVTVLGYVNEEGRFNALTVILGSTGQAFAFRDANGDPLWTGGTGQAP